MSQVDNDIRGAEVVEAAQVTRAAGIGRAIGARAWKAEESLALLEVSIKHKVTVSDGETHKIWETVSADAAEVIKKPPRRPKNNYDYLTRKEMCVTYREICHNYSTSEDALPIFKAQPKPIENYENLNGDVNAIDTESSEFQTLFSGYTISNALYNYMYNYNYNYVVVHVRVHWDTLAHFSISFGEEPIYLLLISLSTHRFRSRKYVLTSY